MMKFWQNEALNRKFSLEHAVETKKSHSQQRLDAKGSLQQEPFKFMAKRTFSTQNNVKPSLGEKWGFST